MVQWIQADNCSWAGFQLTNGASFNTVMGNVMSRNVAGIRVQSGSMNNRILSNTIADNNKMSRLTATPANDDSGAFGVLLNGDSNEVAYNTISGSEAFSYDYGRDGAAVEVYGGRFNDIHHNLSLDNETFGELGNSRASNNSLSYNVVRSSLATSKFVVTRGPLTALGPVSSTRLYNNSVALTGTQSQGFVCYGGCTRESLYMRNNIISARWKAGYADGPIDEDYNLFYGGRVQFQLGARSAITDPGYTNAQMGDLRLRPGSRAIDTGVWSPYSADFQGGPVPRDGDGNGTAATDLGAFEFMPGGSAPAPTPTPAPVISPRPTPTATPGVVGTAIANADVYTFAEADRHTESHSHTETVGHAIVDSNAHGDSAGANADAEVHNGACSIPNHRVGGHVLRGQRSRKRRQQRDESGDCMADALEGQQCCIESRRSAAPQARWWLVGNAYSI